MTRLWVPNATRYPDAHNFFDLALAMQEALTAIQDLEQRKLHAQFAIEALGERLSGFDPYERELSLQSNTALYEVAADNLQVVQDIGIRGELDDISYEQLPGMPLGLSLGVNTHETFVPSNPDVAKPTRATFRAPIACVEYVEITAEPLQKQI